jgi:MarR family 2-MHQ and catechol resistance regulon transcriptional repressor
MKESQNNGVHAWLVLWKATRSLEAHALQSIESLDMCGSDFAILEALLHKGPMPVNSIGQKILLTSGSITTAVDRLAKRGLVKRMDDANDRRIRHVHLTPAGKKLIETAFAKHTQDMDYAVSVLSKKELDIAIPLLKKLGKGAAALLNDTNPNTQATIKPTARQVRLRP